MNIENQLTHAMLRMADIQRAMVEGPTQKSIGKQLAESDALRDLLDNKAGVDSAGITLKSAIVGTQTINDPLGAPYKPFIGQGAARRLTIRGLCPRLTTEAAAVEFGYESTFTNNAALQVDGSPEQFQNVAFAESGITWANQYAPCVSIGHLLPVSAQLFDDAGQLEGFIRSRLLHGLALAEEDRLLNGTGGAGDIQGFLDNATAYTTQSPELTNEIDIIAEMVEQLQVAGFSPEAIVMHPTDWKNLSIRKRSVSDDGYAAGDPLAMGPPRIWGVPVLVTQSIAAGTVLLGDFTAGCVLFDREQANIMVARHDGTNFQKNMLTIRAMERIALVVYNAAAFVKASI